MASAVHVQIISPAPVRGIEHIWAAAAQVFGDVVEQCSRFEADSDLMQANATPGEWVQVRRHCLDLIRNAEAAHRETGGLFDPRIHEQLVRNGYATSWDDRERPRPGSAISSDVPASAPDSAQLSAPWQPQFDTDQCAVQLGEHSIDLGGIGKGYAVDLCAELLRDQTAHAHPTGGLVNAGGDLRTWGLNAQNEPWKVGVEDPWDATTDRAVLAIGDTACATSSVTKRRWATAGSRKQHHLIDPRTGASADSGLLSVTVLHPSCMQAEIWSKALLIAGAHDIAARTEELGLAAVWFTSDGNLHSSLAMAPHLIWQQ